MKGVKPEWANLPRRKCDDCGKGYKPKQPAVKEKQRGFCCDTCRKSYHKHGGAYRKLRVEMERLVSKRMEELAVQMQALLKPILDDVVTSIVWRELATFSAKPSPDCRHCQGIGSFGEHGTGKRLRCYCLGPFPPPSYVQPESKPVPLPNRSRRA